jgi:hypothetical protein
MLQRFQAVSPGNLRKLTRSLGDKGRSLVRAAAAMGI